MTVEMAKKYYSSNINKNIKNIKQMANKKVLKVIKMIYLNFKKIYNAEII